jgi:hypothetical protein
MPKNNLIKFLVDVEQYDRIKRNSSAKGFKTISSYLRDLALNKDRRFEELLVDIHREVINNGRFRD